MLYSTGAVKFDEVIKSAINEERRMLSFDSKTVILVYRLKNKVKEKNKSAYSYNDFEHNQETCGLCKTAGRKYRYPSAKCWTKFSYLKPEKFMSEKEKKKKM